LQLLDVAMRVDAARQHQQPPGVERAIAVEPVGDGGNAAITDADICAHGVGPGDHSAAAHHQVERHAELRKSGVS